MNGCRSKVLAAVALAVALSAPPAAAQSGPPVNLLPGQRAAPPPPAAVAPPPVAPAPASPVPGGVEARALRPVDPAGAGVLGPQDGGLGPELWAGVGRPLAEALVGKLPMATPSRASTALARRLLLTAATPPQGAAAVDWLALRVERLTAGGLLDDAGALAALAPAGAADPALAFARAQIQLLSGEPAKACAAGPGLLGRNPEASAMKVMAFCRHLAGDRAQVELYEGLLRESGHKDPLFARLMTALERPGGPAIDSFKGAAPVHFAMLRAAKRALPADSGETAPPLALRAIADTPSAPVKARLAAAERAEAMGALPADALRELYAAAPGAGGAAAAWQAVQRETLPPLRAKAIAEALKAARKTGGYLTQARVHAPALREIEPTAELAWFAADAGRALAAAGAVGRAYDWLAVAQKAASPANPDAAVAVVTLWPILAVADSKDRMPVNAQILSNWRAAQNAADPAFRERAGLLYAILEALGDAVPDADWAALAEGPLVEPAPAPTALVDRGLTRAAGMRAVGAAATFALIGLGEHGPAGASPATVAAAAAALVQVGLAGEARALALEALIARGF